MKLKLNIEIDTDAAAELLHLLLVRVFKYSRICRFDTNELGRLYTYRVLPDVPDDFPSAGLPNVDAPRFLLILLAAAYTAQSPPTQCIRWS